MDELFPYLEEKDSYRFPSVHRATPEGIVALGGNLSPGMLLSAYRQGIFPWYSPGDPILWWSPDPRFVLFPHDIHVSRSMRRILRTTTYRICVDTAFNEVISAAAAIPRSGQDGTWITPEMEEAYIELHREGWAHSVEVYDGDALIGGLYGVS